MIGKVFVRLLAGLLIGSVLGVLAVAYSVWSVARDTDNRHADTIVVLGAAQYNGVPSKIFQWRLQHALDLWREGYADTIVTVGGNRAGDEFTEASAGKRWLVEKGGVPSDRVVAVEKGSNTLTSAKALGPVFAEHSWRDALVVTDPPHTLRAKAMLAAQGITVYGSPTRAGPAVQSRMTQFEYIVRETGALLYYGFIGGSPESGLSIA
ncbi:YdcF family protein [Cumulibacter manganitolerans]|uniref:YdcF family protein n=1 Tax=Cumulibacter manganitolerans TaxID=1884992 RepID=UPI001295E86D|nr:YdcF family protein [Cumulibacter manganitolerans]